MLPPAFLKEVRNRAAFSHMVIFSDHGVERATTRQITTREVLNVLLKGRIEDGPTWNAEYDNFEGLLRHYVAGRDLCVAVALLNGSLMVKVITAYPKGR